MPRFGAVTDPYAILGLETSATAEEVKKAYRKLVRESHPDLVQGEGEKAAATVRFRQVQEAYECLSVSALKAEYDERSRPTTFDDFFGANSWNEPFAWNRRRHDYDAPQPEPVPIPEPENIIIDGVTVGVKYRRAWNGVDVWADLYVNYNDAHRLHRIPSLPKAKYEENIYLILMNEELYHIEAYSLNSDRFGAYLNRYKKTAQAVIDQNEYKLRLEELRLQRDALYHLGRPVSKLDQAIREMGALLGGERRRRTQNPSYIPISLDALIKAARTIENEIDHIKDGGSQLLVDGLMDGSIYHPHVDANQAILDDVDVFTIRTGNQFDTEFTEGRLYDFYVQRAGDVSSVFELADLDLLIDRDDFILDESDLDGLLVAPLGVALPSNKSIGYYPVTYSYREVDGSKVAIATIRMARSVYDKVGCEYARKPIIPELPYGIRWFIEVTLDEKVIASGWDDEALRKRVEKHKKAQQRGSKMNHDEQNRYEATMPPPWSNARFRRR